MCGGPNNLAPVFDLFKYQVESGFSFFSFGNYLFLNFYFLLQVRVPGLRVLYLLLFNLLDLLCRRRRGLRCSLLFLLIPLFLFPYHLLIFFISNGFLSPFLILGRLRFLGFRLFDFWWAFAFLCLVIFEFFNKTFLTYSDANYLSYFYVRGSLWDQNFC